MSHAFLLPPADHLSSEPQLASLAVLEAAANVTILALAAEYPELASDVDLREPIELQAAGDLIELARAIALTITRYRRVLVERLAREREQDELLPF